MSPEQITETFLKDFQHARLVGEGVVGYWCEKCRRSLTVEENERHDEECQAVDHTRRASYRIAAALERIADCMEAKP